jgi:NAD(P)H-dependent FMN reductase
MLNVAIIIGSTRPGRRGEAVARWTFEIARKRDDASYELVDTTFKPLPHHEESVNAMLDQVVSWGGALKALRG